MFKALSVLLSEGSLPMKVVLEGSTGWFDVHAIAGGQAYGKLVNGSAHAVALTTKAKLNATGSGRVVKYYPAVRKSRDGQLSITNKIFATVDAAIEAYDGEGAAVVRLATELPAVLIEA